MFWDKFYKNIGIKRKIFLASTFIIIIGFLILYLSIYLFLPGFYNDYKVNNLENKVKEFIIELSEKTYDDVNKIIDKFSFENGINIVIKNEAGKSVYSSFREGFDMLPKEEENKIHIDRPRDNFEKVKKTHYNLKIEEEFYFKDIDKNCIFEANAFLTVKYDTKKLIIIFFPVAIGTIIIIAATIGFFYSKIISKPLLEINDKAKKMSNLDFSQRFNPKGKDEISELSTSLNVMCDKLENNINELEEANIKLQADIEKEREAQKERKEFIATISHELKSPITVIAGLLEGMIYKIGKYKDRDKYLIETYDTTKEMEKLVMEILELSRREKDSFKIDKDNFNIASLINKAIEDNNYFIKEKKLKLITDIDESVEILGDKKLINKAVINIIRNAVFHSPKEEKVIINLTKEKLIVRNTGVTLEEKEINNIFNAFYRIDKSRNSNTGGTGLGLYIVKSILDKHEQMEYGIISKDNYVEFKIKFNK